jgi:O-antigen ligase
VARPPSPPPAVRRLADALLAFTAASAPLSISGMQIGMGTLGVLALAGVPLGWGVVRRTPLDGVLALFFGACALSTLASGHPLQAAAGWPRPLWLLAAYFATFWWLRDRAHGVRLARLFVAAGAVAGAYGVLQHFTGVDWYRAALGRATRVRPRIPGAEGFAVVGFFRNYLSYAHAMIFPLAWAAAFALRGSVLGIVAATLLTLAIVFSTARGVWMGVAAGGLLLAVLAGGSRGRALVLAGVAVAALAVAASPGLRAQAAPIFTLGGLNVGRVAIYEANLDISHDHPLFGLGFGRYKRASPPYYHRHPEADRRSHAHSNVLQIAAEAGLLGLGAFCLLFAVILQRGFPALREADPAQWATAAGAWVGIATFFLAGLTQYSFGDAEVVIPDVAGDGDPHAMCGRVVARRSPSGSGNGGRRGAGPNCCESLRRVIVRRSRRSARTARRRGGCAG